LNDDNKGILLLTKNILFLTVASFLSFAEVQQQTAVFQQVKLDIKITDM